MNADVSTKSYILPMKLYEKICFHDDISYINRQLAILCHVVYATLLKIRDANPQGVAFTFYEELLGIYLKKKVSLYKGIIFGKRSG